MFDYDYLAVIIAENGIFDKLQKHSDDDSLSDALKKKTNNKSHIASVKDRQKLQKDQQVSPALFFPPTLWMFLERLFFLIFPPNVI